MQECKASKCTIRVFTLMFFLLLPTPHFAGEIQGAVTGVEGKVVHIQIDANASINIGDKVVIGSELPGIGVVFIDAQWKVVKTNTGSVTAESDQLPPSAPRPGYLATITTFEQKTIQQDKSGTPDLETEQKKQDDSEVALFRLNREKGLSARKHKNYAEALQFFKKAEEIKPEDEELIGLIAFSLYLQEEYIESIGYCEKLLELNEFEYKAYGILGINYKRLNELPKAVESFQKVIELKPNDHAAMVNLVDIYFKLKEYENCEKYIVMYEEIIDKEDLSLLTAKRRELIKKTLDRFAHYKSVIQENEN